MFMSLRKMILVWKEERKDMETEGKIQKEGRKIEEKYKI